MQNLAVNSTHGSGPELILRPVNVEHRGDRDEQPPPGPLPDPHELPDILLDATDRDILNLEIRNTMLIHVKHLLVFVLNFESP